MAGPERGGLRLFFAVPLPDRLASALEPAVRRLQAAGWRPVAAPQRHLTVRFLGERGPEEVPELLRAAGRAAATLSPFVLEVGGVAAFPDARRPEVVVAACTAGRAEFGRLAAAFHALPPAADPRRAVPHVTLARRPARLSPAAAGASWAEFAAACGGAAWGALRVRDVLLVRSELGAGPPRYHPMGRVALGSLAPPGTDGLP